jgi:hypothetical protein
VFVRAEVSEIVLDDAGKVTHHVTVVCGWWCGVRDVVRYAKCFIKLPVNVCRILR